jgi:predicted regulator of Ras-like GTPase activity (Roadblock/LC7/MglB family)
MAVQRPAETSNVHVPRVEARPPASVDQRLRRALNHLADIDGFVACAVSRTDGLVIQHTMKSAAEAARLCAMAAAMCGASGATGSELKQGEFSYAIVRYAEGIFVLREAGRGAVLAALLSSDAKLGMVLLRLKEVSMLVGDILQEVS